MSGSDRLIDVTLDETGLAPPTPEIEQERRVAIFDLLEENRFALPQRPDRPVPPGPYRLTLAIRDGRLVLELATTAGEAAGEIHLSLTPFRQVVKDYFQICESYFDAVKRLPPAQIEAIDMGRRGVHDEHPDGAARRQGRHRHQHRAAAVHPHLRPALQGMTRWAVRSRCSSAATTTPCARPWPRAS